MITPAPATPDLAYATCILNDRINSIKTDLIGINATLNEFHDNYELTDKARNQLELRATSLSTELTALVATVELLGVLS